MIIIQGKIEIIQTTTLSKLTRMLRRALEAKRLAITQTSVKTSMKNLQREK